MNASLSSPFECIIKPSVLVCADRPEQLKERRDEPVANHYLLLGPLDPLKQLFKISLPVHQKINSVLQANRWKTIEPIVFLDVKNGLGVVDCEEEFEEVGGVGGVKKQLPVIDLYSDAVSIICLLFSFVNLKVSPKRQIFLDLRFGKVENASFDDADLPFFPLPGQPVAAIAVVPASCFLEQLNIENAPNGRLTDIKKSYVL